VAYARERERALRICAAAREVTTLRLELLEAIRRVAGFDAYAWLVTDPETSVGCAPLADVRARGRIAASARRGRRHPRPAREMFVSEHTVQDYLKSIFTKTSVRSRGVLLSRVLGP